MKQSRRTRQRAVSAIGGAALVSLLLSATASAAPTLSNASQSRYVDSDNNVILTVVGNTGGPQPRTFNPYLPTSGLNALYGAAGMIYEPLAQNDGAEPDIYYPWLAKSWTWSNDDKTLTFNLRQGVKWSDGVPFTSADVAFTLEMLKSNPELNSYGVSFSSITTKGPLTVVMTFTQPAFTQFYYIASQVYIVPKHIWENVKDPATWANPNPIGTGPFILSSFSPSAMLLTRNPNYWQKGLPKIYGLRYVEYSNNTTELEASDSGIVDWGPGPLPNGQKLYVDKAPQYNHYWYPATGIVSLLPNEHIWPLNVTAVRQAISLAINRQEIDTIGESGYEAPVTNATGVLLPNFGSQLDPSYKNAALYDNITEAKQILSKAGFSVSGGILSKAGKQVSLTLGDPSGFSDYMTDDEIIASELKAIGIKVTVEGLSTNAWDADLADGNFQMTLDWSNVGPLYEIYNGLLDYQLSAPIGKNAFGGDYERWDNSETQALFKEYQTTPSAAGRAAAINGLEGIMVKDVPVIPLVGAASWASFTTRHVHGWPSPSDPYETASEGTPEGEVVALHLVPGPGSWSGRD